MIFANIWYDMITCHILHIRWGHVISCHITSHHITLHHIVEPGIMLTDALLANFFCNSLHKEFRSNPNILSILTFSFLLIWNFFSRRNLLLFFYICSRFYLFDFFCIWCIWHFAVNSPLLRDLIFFPSLLPSLLCFFLSLFIYLFIYFVHLFFF